MQVPPCVPAGLSQRLPDFQLGLDAPDNLVGVFAGAGLTVQVGRADAIVNGFQRRFVDGPAGHGRVVGAHIAQQRRPGQDHRHRVGHVFPLEAGRGAMWRFREGGLDIEMLIETEDDGFRPGDGAEHLEHEIAEDVAIAVERGDHQRLAGRFQQQRHCGVDQLWLVAHLGVTLRGGVELLFENALVNGADGEFRPAEDRGLVALGVLAVGIWLIVGALSAPSREAAAVPSTPTVDAAAPAATTAPEPPVSVTDAAAAEDAPEEPAPPSDALVSFACNPDCDQIKCGDDVIEDIREEVRLEVGTHTCTATKRGYLPNKKTIVVKAGEDAKLSFRLWPVPARRKPPPAKTCGTILNPCK